MLPAWVHKARTRSSHGTVIKEKISKDASPLLSDRPPSLCEKINHSYTDPDLKIDIQMNSVDFTHTCLHSNSNNSSCTTMVSTDRLSSSSADSMSMGAYQEVKKSSLMSLLQKERIDCGKVSPWRPVGRNLNTQTGGLIIEGKQRLEWHDDDDRINDINREANPNSAPNCGITASAEEASQETWRERGGGMVAAMSIPLVKFSRRPYQDLRQSMCEMVTEIIAHYTMMVIDADNIKLREQETETEVTDSDLMAMATTTLSDSDFHSSKNGYAGIVCDVMRGVVVELEELIYCYLTLNSPHLSHLIQQAFSDVWTNHALIQLQQLLIMIKDSHL